VGVRDELGKQTWMPDALNEWRSFAEPFRQETSREGRWCNSIRNILLGDDGIHMNCYHELRCVGRSFFSRRGQPAE
jgi:hypothetical protein